MTQFRTALAVVAALWLLALAGAAMPAAAFVIHPDDPSFEYRGARYAISVQPEPLIGQTLVGLYRDEGSGWRALEQTLESWSSPTDLQTKVDLAGGVDGYIGRIVAAANVRLAQLFPGEPPPVLTLEQQVVARLREALQWYLDGAVPRVRAAQ